MQHRWRHCCCCYTCCYMRAALKTLPLQCAFKTLQHRIHRFINERNVTGGGCSKWCRKIENLLNERHTRTHRNKHMCVHPEDLRHSITPSSSVIVAAVSCWDYCCLYYLCIAYSHSLSSASIFKCL